MSDSTRQLIHFPWIILAAALALTAIGLLGIHSATYTVGPDGKTIVAQDVILQGVWLVVGLAALVVLVRPSYLKLAPYSYALYLAALALLAGLLAASYYGGIPYVAMPRNNAFSWYQVPIPGLNVSVQPAELAKIAFIMALARYLTRRQDHRRPRGLVLPFLMALVPTLLVIRQPDLGTALMFMPVLFLMLVAAGAKLRHLLAVVGLAVALAPMVYLKLDGFQQRRIDTWLLAGPVEHFHLRQSAAAREGRNLADAEKEALLHELRGSLRVRAYLAADYAKWWMGRNVGWLFGPRTEAARRLCEQPYRSKLDPANEAEPSLEKRFQRAYWFSEDLLHGPGYQPWQAKVAVGAGGATGQGFGRGSQTQNRMLAEARNDFIFAVIAEEWGFVGALIVIMLYLVIIIFGVDVGLSTNEPYGKLLAAGVVALISSQALLNIAIASGLMPVTGIPLPLVSYGGSSLVSSYIAIALLCNVGMRRYMLNEPQPFRFCD